MRLGDSVCVQVSLADNQVDCRPPKNKPNRNTDDTFCHGDTISLQASNHQYAYRPVSNLSLISKLIERVVKSRLTEHLSSNNLLNPHQSAYNKHHSTETALLYIYDNLISCLCLLDLSAAFDTITRLWSWFGLHGSVLEWFKSYLSDRCFRVKCENSFSSSHACSCGVNQRSVLGFLFFVLYTTSLSTLISSLSLNHHLYAGDTQLFFSFYPSDLESSITHLQNALQQITSCMTANLLT